jgi:acyl carrier protein
VTQDFRSDPDLRSLARDIGEGRCVLFLGSGISLAAGFPSWTGLEALMKQKAGIRGDYGPLRTADCCRHALGSKAFHDLLEGVFRIDAEPTPLHRRLAKLPVKAYVTTNYDTLMEDALFDERGRSGVHVLANSNAHLWPHVDALGSATWVLKIHGNISDFPKGVVVGERDYLRFSTDYPHVVGCLSSLFARNSVLFLGYSLSDANVAQILFDVHRLTADFSTNRYFVGIDADPLMTRLFESNYGLRCLNIQTCDGGQEAAVINLLDQLAREFEVPEWFISVFYSLNFYTGHDPLRMSSPLSSIFAGFDSTPLIRLGLRIEERLGIRLPLERILEATLDIRGLLRIVEECKSRQGG